MQHADQHNSQAQDHTHHHMLHETSRTMPLPMPDQCEQRYRHKRPMKGPAAYAQGAVAGSFTQCSVRLHAWQERGRGTTSAPLCPSWVILCESLQDRRPTRPFRGGASPPTPPLLDEGTPLELPGFHMYILSWLLKQKIRAHTSHTPTVLHTSVIAQRRRPQACGVECRLRGAAAGLQAAAQRGGG